MGGIGALLAEPNGWDWREVETYLLPQLSDLIARAQEYRKEIADALEQRRG